MIPQQLSLCQGVKLDPNTYLAWVTVPQAHDWLSRNKENRKPSPVRIQHWQSLMKTGRFLTTHQGIAITDTEDLLDGQNRLLGLIEYGSPVRMRVTLNEPRANFAAIDQGWTRQASQFLSHVNSQTIGAAARYIGFITRTSDATRFNGPRATNQSMSTTLEIVEAWPELIQYAATCATIQKTTKITGSIHLSVIAIATRTPYRDSIDPWLAGLASGSNLGLSDPRLFLRNRYLVDHKLLSNSLRTNGYALIIKAWNAFAQGKEMKQLRYGSGEELPTIIGYP